MEKDKLGTGRIVCFSEFKLMRSYTLECSFLGSINKIKEQVAFNNNINGNQA